MNFKAKRWSDIVGNQRLKSGLKKIVSQHKQNLTFANKPKLHVIGPSRSGKTESIEMFARVITCQDLDDETLDPCDGACKACEQNAMRFGISGLYSEFWTGGVEFIPIDCGMVSTLDSLMEKLDVRETHAGRTRIYFLDEIHRLFRKKLDEALLKTVEQTDAYWFFATAKPDEIDDMFANRLITISTELPSKSDLASWLQQRCIEQGLDLTPHEILEICRESNLIPGLALKKIAERALFA